MLPEAINTLKLFTGSYFSVDVIKALCSATSITLPKASGKNYNMIISSLQENENSQKKRILSDTSVITESNYQIKVRNSLLQMIYELMTLNQENINKFGTNISVKWTFMFMEISLHPHTIVIASRILTVLSLNGFQQNSSYHILKRLMSHHGKIQMLYSCWLAILIGANIALIPFSFTFAETLANIQQYIKVKGRLIHGEIFPVILRMLQQVVRELISSVDPTEQPCIYHIILLTITCKIILKNYL